MTDITFSTATTVITFSPGVQAIAIPANLVSLEDGRDLQYALDNDLVSRTGEETLSSKTLQAPTITGPAGDDLMRFPDDRISIRQPLSMNDNFFSMWTFASRAAFEATNVPGWVLTWTIMQGGRPVRFRRDASATNPAITSVNGVKGMPNDVFTPLHWGAIGNGVTDDGAAMNAAFAAYKAAVEAVSDQAGALVFSGLGLQYKTTVSLNYTGVSTWGHCVRDMTIFGACYGKAVLDCIGSRGGLMDHVIIVGDEVARPTTGIQFARAAAGGQEGFCDNWQMSNVHTRGYFSVAGGYFYGQETTTYSHCSFWNSDHTGHAAIHSGYDIYPMASDYLAPITGGTSYINNKYLNCDYRFYPAGQTAAITGISKANPAVVTAPGHPFSIGDTVAVGYISGGMVEANGTVATISAATSSTITLDGVDSTGWTTYTSGGVVVQAQTKASVLFARGSQHVFDCCYAVNYGSNHVEFAFPDSFTPLDIRFDLLCEGTGNTSCLRFTTGTNARAVRGFSFRTYAVHTNDAVISTDATGAGQVTLSEVSIAALSVSNSETPDMFAPEGEFAVVGGTVTAYAAASIDPANFIQFKASLHTIDTLTVRRVRERIEASQLGHVAGAGVGGTVTQITSKTTGVTLNKRSGLITMEGGALGSLASAMFRLTNSEITSRSVVVVNVASGASNYRSEVIRTSTGLCDIRITNLSGGVLSDAVQIRFLVLEGADD